MDDIQMPVDFRAIVQILVAQQIEAMRQNLLSAQHDFARN